MRTNVLLLLALSLLLSSCTANIQSLVTKQNKVENGMSKEQVVKIMGEPGNKQFNGTYEAWQYCATNYSLMGGDHYVTVWFNYERVYALTTHKNYAEGQCEAFFKEVEWNHPDRTIEIRNR